MPTLYVTAPPEVAEDLARTLVEERLAACVNRVPCTSTYRWEGEVVEDSEEILLVKTTEERCDAAVARLVEEHPYDVPCIERFDVEYEDEFGAWVAESTDADDGPTDADAD
ncbi:divalent-cation tolerance protein CutA [Salinigranum rubrum]|uniref:Divalent-cation tolerance protein CutA n=1 Tax=Salinigranum rubrum TaxID=755307 RepID=A0A2I8VIT7_9EURY|nr:divalent-cation tolerance protein CutA [Salinigranum rubrum]AUV81830.1 divalent-cation tolerance protein CutA [Salinigranum rubrum]